MDTELDSRCIGVLNSKSVGDLLHGRIEFSQDCDFGRMSATVITQHSPTLREHQYITKSPSAHIPDFEDFGAAGCDSVSQPLER
jgi:hypothetical protein